MTNRIPFGISNFLYLYLFPIYSLYYFLIYTNLSSQQNSLLPLFPGFFIIFM